MIYCHWILINHWWNLRANNRCLLLYSEYYLLDWVYIYIKSLKKHTRGHLVMFSFCHTKRKVETYDAMMKMSSSFLYRRWEWCPQVKQASKFLTVSVLCNVNSCSFAVSFKNQSLIANLNKMLGLGLCRTYKFSSNLFLTLTISCLCRRFFLYM